MSMTVACPGCATQLAVAPEMVGQVLGCPHCHSQFQVGAPAAVAAAAPPPAPQNAGVAASGVAPRWRGDLSMMPLGFKLNETPAPAAPAKAAVPKFKPADLSTTSVSLAQDGKLPELSLAAGQGREAKAPPVETQSRPLMLSLVLVASLVLSVCLALIDFSPVEGDADARERAQLQIATFYKESAAALEPYQLLLRDAQRAHSRGDQTAERANYREVLRMLRSEHRPTSLTESHQGDRDLEAAIADVLRNE